MDRREEITKFIRREQRGIEIGPYHSPLTPKRLGYNCLVLDVFDTVTLRERARIDPNIPKESISLIEEVDLVGSSSAIAESVAKTHDLGTFDYIVSSHNFEHLPDPIRFLRGCQKALKQGGILSMALPDKRTCFDYFRPHSTLAEMLQAHFEKRSRPTQSQLFEQASLHCRYIKDTEEFVTFALNEDRGGIVPLETLGDAFRAWRDFEEQPDNVYRDAHCWTLTPASFELILRDLSFLGLITFEVLEISDTCGNEFYVHLENRPSDDRDHGAFYDRRRMLLHQIQVDICPPSPSGSNENPAAISTSLAAVGTWRAQKIAALEAELEALKCSKSWRLTAPLRALSGALRRARQRQIK